MNFEMAKKCVDTYLKIKYESGADVSPVNVHFGNCEPLINFSAMKQVVEYCNRQYPAYEFLFSVNTNLSLLNEEMARFLIENKVQIYTSLDGPKEGNDAIRIYKNGSGTYDDIMEKFQLLRSLDAPIRGISITINDRNFQYIDDAFLDWCVKMEFVSIAADFDLVNSTSISNEDKIEFLCSTWKKLTLLGIEFYGTWMTPFIKLSNECAAEKAFAFCRASEGYNFSVDTQGNVYACSYSDTSMASQDDFKESISPRGTYYEYVHNRLVGNISDAKCQKCFLYGSCAGQCEMSKISMDPITLEAQCDFYRGVTEQMLITQANLMEEV